MDDVAGNEAAESMSTAVSVAEEGMVSRWSVERGGGPNCAETGSQEAAKRCAMVKLVPGGRVCDVRRMVVRWRRKKRRSLRATKVRRSVMEKKAEGEVKVAKCQQRLQVLKVLGRFRQWQRSGRHRLESRVRSRQGRPRGGAASDASARGSTGSASGSM